MRKRQLNYLNFILTVNAVLLLAIAWGNVAEQPMLSQAAEADTRRFVVPNAADQRQKMIDALKGVRQSVNEQTRLLESGKVKVEVTNLDEVRVEINQGGG